MELRTVETDLVNLRTRAEGKAAQAALSGAQSVIAPTPEQQPATVTAGPSEADTDAAAAQVEARLEELVVAEASLQAELETVKARLSADGSELRCVRGRVSFFSLPFFFLLLWGEGKDDADNAFYHFISPIDPIVRELRGRLELAEAQRDSANDTVRSMRRDMAATFAELADVKAQVCGGRGLNLCLF